MGATRLASGIVQLLFSGFCVSFLFIFPTRDASPPLEVAFVGGVLCLKKRKLLRLKKRKLLRLLLAFSACVRLRFTIQPYSQTIAASQHATMYPPKNQILPFYLHLALFACTKLIIRTLRSVGTPAHYLH